VLTSVRHAVLFTPQMDRLHAPSPEVLAASGATAAPQQHRKHKLRGRKAKAGAGDDSQDATDDQGQDVGAARAAATQLPPLDMHWMCVLWQRGLRHVNVQVSAASVRSAAPLAA
jgi:hypothetical protein